MCVLLFLLNIVFLSIFISGVVLVILVGLLQVKINESVVLSAKIVLYIIYYILT